MKRLIALFIVGVLAFVPLGARAAASLIDLGNSQASAVLTTSLTVTANVPSGSGGILVVGDIHNTPGTVSVTDSQGNTYVQVSAVLLSGSSDRTYLFRCINPTHALTSGTDTITFASTSGSGLVLFEEAVVITGGGTLTVDSGGSGAFVTSLSVAGVPVTGHAGLTLSTQPAIIIGAASILAGSGLWTADTTNLWTLGPQHAFTLSVSPTLGFQLQNVTVTTAVPFKPSYSVSTTAANGLDEVGYDIAAAPVSCTRRALTGAGC